MDEKWIKETEESDKNGNLVGRLQPLLLTACQRNLPNLDVIKALVEDLHVNINAKTKPDNRKAWYTPTAIHALAGSNYWWQASALEYLLKHGVTNEIKNEALHVAIKSEGGDVTSRILLKYGANPNFIGEDGLTCLNKASKNPGIVRHLLNYGANASAGKKPFIFDAIETFNLEIIKFLVEMGVDFNIKPEPEKEPEFGENEMENMLILRRMMFKAKELAEESYPIHFAASSRFNTVESRPKVIPIIEILLQGGANPFLPYDDEEGSIIHELYLSEGIIKPFLSLPTVDLEAPDSSGRTLLLAACSTDPGYSGSPSTKTTRPPSNIQILLNHGADINAVDNNGRNVLHLLMTCSKEYAWMRAYPKGDFEFVQDNTGATPLHHALRNRQFWAIESLLTKNIDTPTPDPEGNFALHHIAAQFNSPIHQSFNGPLLPEKLFQKFLDLGGYINACNKAGETPGFNLVSVRGVSVKQVQMLKEKGADLMIANLRGQGLLHAVAKVGGVEVFRYLMEKGLDHMTEDDENRSALDVASASEECSVGILEIFQTHSRGTRPITNVAADIEWLRRIRQADCWYFWELFANLRI